MQATGNFLCIWKYLFAYFEISGPEQRGKYAVCLKAMDLNLVRNPSAAIKAKVQVITLLCILLAACGQNNEHALAEPVVKEGGRASHANKVQLNSVGKESVRKFSPYGECLGRWTFNAVGTKGLEWAVPTSFGKEDPFDYLYGHFDDGTGRGSIEFVSKGLRISMAILGPTTTALRQSILDYRDRMNSHSLAGFQRQLEDQLEEERLIRRNKTLATDETIAAMKAERRATEQSIAEIKAGRYQSKIELGVPNATAFRSDTKASNTFIRGAVALDGHIAVFKAMLLGLTDPTTPNDAEWVEAEASIKDLVSRLRGRQLHEIPREHGLCLPHAFIKDDGQTAHKISASFRFAEYPALIYTANFETIPVGQGSLGTMIKAGGRSATGLFSSLPDGVSVTQRLGPRSAKIGALSAEQGGIVMESREAGNTREGYYVYTGYAGRPGSQLLPGIEVEMESVWRSRYPKLQADPPPYREARSRYDALLKSFHIRSTYQSTPEAELPRDGRGGGGS
ncbi:T6SS immunity protein Tli4 family protein [Cupriavidus alkaliphilus]|uniref:T6SS immunity protein Tli4 family protein n=1 Tax=Cupriavidus alkaliphilus TaxID=942866 RepID=UPI001FC9D82D|nr:T6SS immunity protein Tli4 family protein [Cupriavidus alkaliphilus]